MGYATNVAIIGLIVTALCCSTWKEALVILGATVVMVITLAVTGGA